MMGLQPDSRDRGELGFAEEEVRESRRSKLVPYGLLSSSFHMVPVAVSSRRFGGNQM